jgi:hypothetical protein
MIIIEHAQKIFQIFIIAIKLHEAGQQGETNNS